MTLLRSNGESLIPHPLSAGWVIYRTWQTCDFWDWVIRKDCGFSLRRSIIPREASGHIGRTLKQPYGEERVVRNRPPANSEHATEAVSNSQVSEPVVKVHSRPPSSFQMTTHSGHRDGTLLRNLEPESASEGYFITPDLQELGDNRCLFSLSH